MQALTDSNVRDEEDKIGAGGGTEDPEPRQHNTRHDCHRQRPQHEATHRSKSNTHRSGQYASLVNAACSPEPLLAKQVHPR
jgi:hypothetical protein